MIFETEYDKILQKLENINPIKYAQTRNYVDGAVTYLSPYISRGVISLVQIKNKILEKRKPYQVQKLLQELAWREYWQIVYENLGETIFDDIKSTQKNIAHNDMIDALQNATTNIKAIDKGVENLYKTGYLHNHIRMYIASIACNVGNAHWLLPSQWMYYYLLDGDIASNTLSWQWVAGTFSSKKYYCNQENINKYCYTNDVNTFLDVDYDNLQNATSIPNQLVANSPLQLQTNLPTTDLPNINSSLKTLVYNGYNLDPLWFSSEQANRILLLEPSHFKKFPISDMVLNFVIDLSKNIKGIQIFVEEFSELKTLCSNSIIHYKKHPAFTYYKGEAHNYEKLFPQVSGKFNSFFSYWKKCEKYL